MPNASDISQLTSTITQLVELVNVMSQQIKDLQLKTDEIHTVQTGKLYQSPRRLTQKEKKEIEQKELNNMRRVAHMKVLNRL